jgi:hypothetical protein
MWIPNAAVPTQVISRPKMFTSSRNTISKKAASTGEWVSCPVGS